MAGSFGEEAARGGRAPRLAASVVGRGCRRSGGDRSTRTLPPPRPGTPPWN